MLGKANTIGYLVKKEFWGNTKLTRNTKSGVMFGWSKFDPENVALLLLFAVILVVEIFVLTLHFIVETIEFKVFFLLLMLITSLAHVVFTVEGFLQNKRKSSIKESSI